MVQEHERGLGGWHAEWQTLPELCALAAGALRWTAEAIEGLQLDPARMRATIDVSRGQIMAEAVLVALAPRIGRLEAHEILERASRRAGETGRHLKAVLAEDPAVTQHLSSADLDALFEPLNYLGQATAFVDRVLEARRRQQEEGP
jgi:3-carboxy-cis,cis-muconate cycloisomerase